jgi:hypothetical protein
MYKTSQNYLNSPVQNNSIVYDIYNGPKILLQESNQCNHIRQTPVKTHLNMKKTTTTKDTGDPSVWGPPMWFSLHNGAAKYPIEASPICIEKMKNYIIGLPIMLPCPTCRLHATNHIEKHKKNLDIVCSNRKNLFKFFVDFHNIVNRRYRKKEMSVEDAYRLYNGDIRVTTITYE